MKMQEIIEKLRNDKKLIIFIFIGLLGAVMLIFTDNGTGNDTLNDDIETTSVNVISSAADVEEILETKLISIISQVKGAGKTSAVVTVSSAGEYVYAENIKKESDGNSTSHDSEIVIYESQKGVDSGLILSIKGPDIIGVAIVCEGGESSVVKAEITKLVTSLFGIGSDRVYVGSKSIY